MIAGVHIWPQATALREKAKRLGLPNLRVEKLDVNDSFDVEMAFRWEIDILFSNAGIGEAGIYVSTKHALEAIAESLQLEMKPFGVQVQTINPGAYYTGYNETMADNPFRWLDDKVNFTKRADLRKGFDDFFATPEGRLDPKEMIDRMIEIVPADEGKFRNVVPKVIEDMLKEHQVRAWENKI